MKAAGALAGGGCLRLRRLRGSQPILGQLAGLFGQPGLFGEAELDDLIAQPEAEGEGLVLSGDQEPQLLPLRDFRREADHAGIVDGPTCGVSQVPAARDQEGVLAGVQLHDVGHRPACGAALPLEGHHSVAPP